MLSHKKSLNILKKTNALIEGHFVLSSGLHSPRYIQCAKLLSFPHLAKDICLSLANKIKKKFKNLKGNYSSEGPISVTTKERVKEKGKDIKELKSSHKIIRKISTNYSIYCSPGHFIDFSSEIKNKEKLKKFLFNHQIEKKFQFSLEWEKDQLAIWDNRSMLHQATPYKGNRIMHRITII